MNRIINFTLLLLLLSSCAYEPILNNNQNFSINIIKISGDQTVNSIISKEFKNLKENEKKFDLIIVSTKEKKIATKLFAYSILYLFAIFMFVLIDKII